jgi:hypothetical protein
MTVREASFHNSAELLVPRSFRILATLSFEHSVQQSCETENPSQTAVLEDFTCLPLGLRLFPMKIRQLDISQQS